MVFTCQVYRNLKQAIVAMFLFSKKDKVSKIGGGRVHSCNKGGTDKYSWIQAPA